MTLRVPLLVILGLMLVLACSCRRAGQGPDAKGGAEPPPVQPGESEAPEEVAATVNDQELSEAQVGRLAKERGWKRDKALHVLIDSLLVVQEGRRQKTRCPNPKDLATCARVFLESLYNEKNLCARISETMIDQAYEEVWQKDWPVEAFAGVVAERRCCSGEGCEEPAARACLDELERLQVALKRLARRWRSGENPQALVAAMPGVELKDFFFTYWPEQGPGGQTQLRTWDERMLMEVTSLPLGSISEPVRSRFGLHLFRLDRYKPAKDRNDPEIRDMLRKEVCEGIIARTRDRYIRDLREQAEIRLMKP